MNDRAGQEPTIALSSQVLKAFCPHKTSPDMKKSRQVPQSSLHSRLHPFARKLQTATQGHLKSILLFNAWPRNLEPSRRGLTLTSSICETLPQHA